MDDEQLERDARAVLSARSQPEAPTALGVRVDAVANSTPSGGSRSWLLPATVAFAAVAVIAVGLLIGPGSPSANNPGGNGSIGNGQSATPSQLEARLQDQTSLPAGYVRVCAQVLLPARIQRQGTKLVFESPTGSGSASTELQLAFPAGFRAEVSGGIALLIAPDGTLLGREGDVVSFGGEMASNGVFMVCSVGDRSY